MSAHPYRTAVAMTPAEIVDAILSPPKPEPEPHRWALTIERALRQVYPWQNGVEVCVMTSDAHQALTIFARRTGSSIHSRGGSARLEHEELMALPDEAARWGLVLDRAAAAVRQLTREEDFRLFRIGRRDPKRLRLRISPRPAAQEGK